MYNRFRLFWMSIVGLFLGWPALLQAQSYCIPTYTSGCGVGDYIAGVSLAGFTRASVCDNNTTTNRGYIFRSSDTITLLKGVSYQLTVTNNPTYAEWYGAWLDADTNGWDTSDVIALSSATIPAGQTWTPTFTTPMGSGALTNDTTRIRILCKWAGTALTNADYCGAWSYGETEDYVVILKAPTDTDVAVTTMIGEGGDICAPAALSFNFVISNWGVTLSPGDTVYYSIDTNSNQACSGYYVFSDTFSVGENDTINPGCSFLFSSSPSISIAVSTSGDADASNDTITPVITVLPTDTSAPWADGFEDNGIFEPNTLGEDTLANGWQVNPGGGLTVYRWMTENNQTASFNTGPSAPYSGSRYVYAEASYAGTEATLTSRCLDISSATAPYLVYAYHMYGATMGNLHVEIQGSGSTSWTTVRTWTGQQQGSMTDPWKLDFLDLSSYTSPIRIRFRGERGTSFTSDIAIDSVQVKDLQPDVGVTAIVSPLSGCGLGTNQPVHFTVRNLGASLTSVSVPYEVKVNGTVTCNDTVTLTLVPGEDTTITGCLVNLSSVGVYTLQVYTQYGADTDNGNDTATAVVEHYASTSAPWSDGFEANGLWEPNSTGEDTLAIGWRVNPGGGNFVYRWRTEDGHPTYAYTGPSMPYMGTRYVYVESSYFTGTEATLTSRCVDVSSATTPYLVYAYHMFGQGMGDLHVEVQEAGSTSWTTVRTWSGQQQSAQGDAWKLDFIDLSSYTSPVRVRFRGERVQGSSYYWQGDMAVDEVNIKDLQPDVGVTAVVSPASGCVMGSSDPVHFTVRNLGSSLTSVSVPYEVQVNGTVACSDTLTLTLAPGEDTTVTGCSVNLSGIGVYTVKVYTQYGADTDNSNDTTEVTVEHYASTPVPWADGFENNGIFEPNSVGEDTLAVGWQVNPGGGLSVYRWRTENGHPTYANTGPSLPYSGTRYVYVESSYFTGTEASLTSRCVDISAATSPYLIYAYHMYGQGMGDLHVEIQDSGSTSWTTVRTWTGQQQGSMTDPWKLDFIDLSGYTGPVRVRFRGQRGQGTSYYWQGDMSVDSVMIKDLQPDVGVTSIVSPVSGCVMGSNESIHFTIKNLGSPLSSVSVPYEVQVNGTVACSDTLTLTLAPGEDTTIAGCAVNMSNAGVYTLKVYTQYGADTDNSNDTTEVTVEHYASVSVPWSDGFENNGIFEPNSLGEDTLAVGWQVNPGGGNFVYRWMTENNQTGSFNTGPSTPYSGSRYVYTEASYSGTEATLTSRCVDISTAATPYLVYAYHMYGAAMGSLYVEIQDSGSTSWNTLRTWSGQQQTSMNDPWNLDFIDLSGYTSPVRIRFRAQRGISFTSDMAVDSVLIKDFQPDVSVADILSPKSECALDTESVSFEVINVGANISAGSMLYYTVWLNGTVVCTDSVAVPTNLTIGQSYVINSSCNVVMSSPGPYALRVEAHQNGEGDYGNDTLEVVVDNIPYVQNYPYVEDFETWSGGWQPQSIQGSNDWEWGSPSSDPTSTINTAAGGNKAWETLLNGTYTGNSQAALISPCFDFSQLSDSVEVIFYFNSDVRVLSFGAYAGARLDTMTSRDGTWSKVGTVGDPNNWYNEDNILGFPFGTDREGWAYMNGGWMKARRVIELQGADTARFRFNWAAGFNSTSWTYDGFAIDSFMVGPKGFEYCFRHPNTPYPQLVVADTAYINSPHTLAAAYPPGASGQFWWYVNDSLIGIERVEEYTFTQLGQDTVTLISKTCQGWDTVSKVVVVVNPTSAPVAAFSANPLRLEVNQTVQVTDLSTNGPTTWAWWMTPRQTYDPLNGIWLPNYFFLPDSTVRHPQVIVLQPGAYTLCAAVSNSLGSDTLCISDYIKVLQSVTMCTTPNTTDAKDGILYDNGGESDYSPTGGVCSYLIDPCVEDIELTLHELDLGLNDYLRIYDGQDNTGTPLWDVNTYGNQGMTGSISGPLTFTATSGSVYVEFVADNNTTTVGAGFKLEWKGLNDVVAPVASISGPDSLCVGIPGLYLNDGSGLFLTTEGWDTTGDGVIDVMGSTLDAVFGSPGSYPVGLIVGNCAGYDTAWKVVEVPSGGVQSFGFDFVGSPLVVSSGEEVSLHATSVSGCLAKWGWTFSKGGNPVGVTYVSGSDSEGVVTVTFTDTGCIDVQLIGYGAVDTDTVMKSCYIRVLDYCQPLGVLLSSDVAISRVELGDGLIDHMSPVGQSSYSDYTGSVQASVELGQSYALSVSRSTTYSPVYHKVWVDWDQNGVFDSSELVLSAGPHSVLVWMDTLTVPGDAVLGLLRMRIGVSSTPNFGPCGPVNTGEYEDYGLLVGPDMTPPVLTLLGSDSMTIEECSGYVEPGYTATDLVDGDVTGQVQVLGSVLDTVPGRYELRYVVSDASGNVSDTLVRVVMVLPETVPPVVTLRGPSYVEHDVHTSYVDSGYDAVDNCSGVSVVSTWTNLDTSLLGLYTYRYIAEDVRGNVDSVDRLVEVVDRVAPVITLLGAPVDTIPRLSSYVDPGYTVSDNYYAVSDISVDTFSNLDVTKEGVYYISYRAEDPSGNVSQVASRVIVVAPATGIQPSGMAWRLHVFPNPVNNEALYITYDGNVSLDGVRVETMDGRVMQVLDGRRVRSGTVRYSLQGVPAGTYLLRVWGMDGVYVVPITVFR